MSQQQFQELMRALGASGGSPTAGSYQHFMQGFDPFRTGVPLSPNQLSPNPYRTRATTDPGLYFDESPRAIPVGTPQPVPQFPGNVPRGNWPGVRNPANFVPGTNPQVKSDYVQLMNDLLTRMTQRAIREGNLGGAGSTGAGLPSGQFAEEEPWAEPTALPSPQGYLPQRHEAFDVPPGVFPTPTATPEPFVPTIPGQTVYPEPVTPFASPNLQLPQVTAGRPATEARPDTLPSPPSEAPAATPPGGAPNVMAPSQLYPEAPPPPSLAPGPGLPGPTPGELPSPPGEVPFYPNQTVYPNEIPTYENQVVTPDQYGYGGAPSPLGPQGYDFTGLPNTAPSGYEYLYNPPVVDTGPPPAVTDIGLPGGNEPPGYPYLYNPPVVESGGNRPLDYTGVPQLDQTPVTPSSIFGGDAGNTQATNFVPNPSGGYWGYDDNWNWVGDVSAPPEAGRTPVAQQDLVTPGMLGPDFWSDTGAPYSEPGPIEATGEPPVAPAPGETPAAPPAQPTFPITWDESPGGLYGPPPRQPINLGQFGTMPNPRRDVFQQSLLNTGVPWPGFTSTLSNPRGSWAYPGAGPWNLPPNVPLTGGYYWRDAFGNIQGGGTPNFQPTYSGQDVSGIFGEGLDPDRPHFNPLFGGRSAGAPAGHTVAVG
jgi:hypothetical protein